MRVERPTAIWAGAKGFVTTVLCGTPWALHSCALSPVMYRTASVGCNSRARTATSQPEGGPPKFTSVTKPRKSGCACRASMASLPEETAKTSNPASSSPCCTMSRTSTSSSASNNRGRCTESSTPPPMDRRITDILVRERARRRRVHRNGRSSLIGPHTPAICLECEARRPRARSTGGASPRARGPPGQQQSPDEPDQARRTGGCRLDSRFSSHGRRSSPSIHAAPPCRGPDSRIGAAASPGALRVASIAQPRGSSVACPA